MRKEAAREPVMSNKQVSYADNITILADLFRLQLHIVSTFDRVKTRVPTWGKTVFVGIGFTTANCRGHGGSV